MNEEQVTQWLKENVSGSMEHRKYQIEAWGKLWNARTKESRKRALVHLATGLGKTSVAAVDVLHYIREENPNAKILFVSHMGDISSQAEQTFKRVDPTITTTFFRERTVEDARITFAMFQGLHLSLDLFKPDQFDYIIWDEAHHIEAPTFSRVRNHFQPKFELGLTATPERGDGRDITEYFGKAIFEKSLAEGMNEGWLSPVDYHIVFDQTVKDAMKEGFSTKNREDIKNMFSHRVRNEEISREVLQRREEIGLEEAKTIVFCQNIASAKQMAILLGGDVYHSKLKAEERNDIFRRFKSNKLQVICTVDMFNEGVDIPDTRLIVFLRSTSSRTIFEQQLGRGLRLHPGKKKVTVLDFVANVERINFINELSRHIGRISTSGGWRKDAAEGEEDEETSIIDSNTFEFEDEAIELLKRYNELALANIDREEVVRMYKELRDVRAIAEHFNVSDNAIYRHLKKAGIDTSGHMRNEITDEMVAEAYYRLGSAQKAGAEIGLSSGTVIDRLHRGKYEILKQYPDIISDEKLVEIYEENDRSMRRTAEALNRNRSHIARRLKNIGVDTTRKGHSNINAKILAESYARHNGDIVGIVDDFKSTKGKGRLLRRWAKVYVALDRHGYIENYEGKVTSARAAAAYHKYGTSTKAAEVLGVSNAYISKLTKKALYIRKYKQKKTV